MLLRSDLTVGVASHTGQVRSTNEDDYLILAPSDAEVATTTGRLVAVADGMGGVVGGAEASRAALRALGREILFVRADQLPEERMAAGYAAACDQVWELAQSNPRLRDMGTTMTSLLFVDDRAVLAHVGDTRCLLLRDGELRLLTEDHAVTEPRNLLTRCIGAGQRHEQVDLGTIEVRAGDRFVLLSDGVWGVVPDPELAVALDAARPQDVAEQLVAAANAHGGPDNATAVVIDAARPGADAVLRELELPVEEPHQVPPMAHFARGLARPRWPWVLLAISAVLVAVALARFAWGPNR